MCCNDDLALVIEMCHNLKLIRVIILCYKIQIFESAGDYFDKTMPNNFIGLHKVDILIFF